MTSPEISWDDFGRQALLVQNLLTDPEGIIDFPKLKSKRMESVDSPQFISKMDEPVLVMLSPGAVLHAGEENETLGISSRERVTETDGIEWNDNCTRSPVKECVKQIGSQVRTPLKDCTNIRKRETKVPHCYDAHEIVTCSRDLFSPTCSADFSEFLTGVTVSSSVFDDNHLGSSELRVKNSQIVTDSPRDLPAVQRRARKGTYDLDTPPCDLSRLIDLEGVSPLVDVKLAMESSLDCLSLDINREAILRDSLSDVNSSLEHRFVDEDDIMESVSVVVESEKHGLEMDRICDAGDCKQVVENGNEVQDKLFIDDGCDLKTEVAQPDEKRLAKRPSLRRPQPRHITAGDRSVEKTDRPQAPVVRIPEAASVSCLSQEKSSCGGNIEPVVSGADTSVNEMTVSGINDKSEERSELNSVIIDKEESVESGNTKLEGAASMILEVSSLEEGCRKLQGKQLAAPEQVSKLKKVMPSSLPGKARIKADPGAADGLYLKPPVTKLPLKEAGHMQMKQTVRRSSSVFVRSKSQMTLPASEEVIGSSAALLPQAGKVKTRKSSLGHRESLGTSSLPKASQRLPSKSTWSQGLVKIQQPTSTSRKSIETKPVEKTAAETFQHMGMKVGNVLRKPDASKVGSSVGRRSSELKGGPALPTVTRHASAMLKPLVPVIKASAKEVNKGPLVPGDGTRAVTKKVPPVKAIFPVDGSRTVTKEDRPVSSRTVAKDDDESVASRTVAKENQPVSYRTLIKENQSDGSRTVTKENQSNGSRTMIKENQSNGSRTVIKENQSNGSRTVTKENQSNGSRTVTKENQSNGSRTVTKDKENQSNGSRTVTKDKENQSVICTTVTKEDKPVSFRAVTEGDQPAGSRTVTKTSSDQPSDAAFGIHLQTPVVSEKFIAPRRLTNVFKTPASLSSNGSDTEKRHNSLIPTPGRLNRTYSQSSHGSVSSNSSSFKHSFESPFPGARSGDESEAFKPKHNLVQNTPEVPLRRRSMWSPVRKNRVLDEDVAYQCTKRLKDQGGSQ